MLTGLIAKIKSFASALTGLFKKLTAGPSKNKFNILNKVRQFFREKIPGKKERFILIGSTAAVLVIVLIANIIMMMMRNSGGEQRTAAAADTSGRIIIGPEELFIPEEPDFIPEVLLERERRTVWTADDAAQYWQDPLKSGEDPWRGQIELAIDELMERVP